MERKKQINFSVSPTLYELMIKSWKRDIQKEAEPLGLVAWVKKIVTKYISQE